MNGSTKTKDKMAKVSENRKNLIHLELRKLRFNVSRAINLLDKAILLYVIFLLVAVFGSVMGYISQKTVVLLVLMGIALLFIGAIPYFKIMMQEEARMNSLISAARKLR
jgi:hypothetical protein